MSLQLFGHPFRGKVLIALWADQTRSSSLCLAPVTRRTAASCAAVRRSDNSRCWLTAIDQWPRPPTSFEHLQAHHPGPHRSIPDGELGRRVASSTACLASA